MDKDNITIELHLFDILLGDFKKKSEVSVRNILSSAMQGIVEFLGHLEKLGVSFNGIPAGIYTKLFQQRQHATQDLGYATSGKG
jgi:hypothetical protein